VIAPALLETPAALRPSGRQLRPYQHEACGALAEDWSTGVTRPAILLPTGCGKTDVIAAWATDEVARGGRVLVLAHRSELLDQITDRVAQHDARYRVGRVQAARDEIHYPVTVAMVQTLAARRRKIDGAGRKVPGPYARLARLPRYTLVIVDECHHAAAPGYLAVLAGLGCFGDAAMRNTEGCERKAELPEPVRAFGVTATLVRGDDAALGDVWQSVAFARDIAWAVRMGFLVRPRGRVVVAQSVKLDKAKVRRGDYTDGELGKMITEGAAQIVADWLEHGRHDDGSRRSTAAFCPDLESAHALAAEFAARGIPVGLVTGATKTHERRKMYRDLAGGRILVLVSIMVLTEGWDCPRVSCILQCRPTKLPGLYTQIVGRGLRPWDVDEAVRTGHAPAGTAPKTDCLILDVVGASRGQKLTTLVDLHESAEYDTSELDEALRCDVCGREHPGEGCPLDDLEGLDVLPPADEDVPGEHVPQMRPDGAQDYDELELLADESDWTWLRTAAGRPFLPVGDRFVFLWEAPGRHPDRWSVGTISSPWAKRSDGAGWLGHGLVLSAGRELAERWAWYEPEANLAQRSARWRKGRATEAQLRQLHRAGVVQPGERQMSKAEVSDLISVALASMAIDRLATW
jgi:superfamily II DNA or RNA helicase